MSRVPAAGDRKPETVRFDVTWPRITCAAAATMIAATLPYAGAVAQEVPPAPPTVSLTTASGGDTAASSDQADDDTSNADSARQDATALAKKLQ